MGPIEMSNRTSSGKDGPNLPLEVKLSTAGKTASFIRREAAEQFGEMHAKQRMLGSEGTNSEELLDSGILSSDGSADITRP